MSSEHWKGYTIKTMRCGWEVTTPWEPNPLVANFVSDFSLQYILDGHEPFLFAETSVYALYLSLGKCEGNNGSG